MAGNLVHVEVPASDTSRSREFWSSLFGWQWQTLEGPYEYHMTQIDERSGAAVYPARAASKGYASTSTSTTSTPASRA